MAGQPRLGHPDAVCLPDRIGARAHRSRPGAVGLRVRHPWRPRQRRGGLRPGRHLPRRRRERRHHPARRRLRRADQPTDQRPSPLPR
ncbi:hypothetical protein E1258_13035 [Micromonospora sp. KC207]|nr:hypothetical protein E1258_13035 [Micromonospora sp. KC207]